MSLVGDHGSEETRRHDRSAEGVQCCGSGKGCAKPSRAEGPQERSGGAAWREHVVEKPGVSLAARRMSPSMEEAGRRVARESRKGIRTTARYLFTWRGNELLFGGALLFRRDLESLLRTPFGDKGGGARSTTREGGEKAVSLRRCRFFRGRSLEMAFFRRFLSSSSDDGTKERSPHYHALRSVRRRPPADGMHRGADGACGAPLLQ